MPARILKLSPSLNAEALFAKEAGLRYVNASDAGIARKRVGKGFTYVMPDGKTVKDKALLARIRSIVIPPAWEDVWICRQSSGHLQATGRDVRGRKQYRYHPDWSKGRNETKFEKLESFGKVLPELRARLKKDLAHHAMDRPRVMAAVVQLMERTGMRIGNDLYAQENDSFGATTIRNRHAKVKGQKVEIRFRGKSGVQHDIEFSDARLSRVIRNCQDLPGQELFAYVGEDGKVHDVGSEDVNSYLKEVAGPKVTAKDIRTWVASVKAIEALWKMGPGEPEPTKKAAKERNCAVIVAAAQFLGNTSAVCRKYYVHPAVFEADNDGFLYRKRNAKALNTLTESEAMLLSVLKKYRNIEKKAA
jgi:DNA topoisomerase-1